MRGSAAQRRLGELGDAVGEADPRGEAQLAPGPPRRGDHVSHVAGPELPGHDRVRASAARLAAATSRTCTKSRRCRPSSKTRGGSPRSRAERKIAATPLYGVSRGIRGPYTLWYRSAIAWAPVARAQASLRCSWASLVAA